MSNSKQTNLLLGTTLAVGLMGTISSFLRAKKKSKTWKDNARKIALQLMKKNVINKNMVLGSFAGGLVGVTAALLLAPKSGADLLKDISHPFSSQEKISPPLADAKTNYTQVKKTNHRAAPKAEPIHADTSTTTHKKQTSKTSQTKKPAVAVNRTKTGQIKKQKSSS
jgi:gas vesicle protein